MCGQTRRKKAIWENDEAARKEEAKTQSVADWAKAKDKETEEGRNTPPVNLVAVGHTEKSMGGKAAKTPAAVKAAEAKKGPRVFKCGRKGIACGFEWSPDTPATLVPSSCSLAFLAACSLAILTKPKHRECLSSSSRTSALATSPCGAKSAESAQPRRSGAPWWRPSPPTAPSPPSMWEVGDPPEVL